MKRIDGYKVTGPLCIMSHGPLATFVARSALPGKPWLRFMKKLSNRGWHVTAYKTKTAATEGRACTTRKAKR